jgi:hypothetical protein
LTPFVVVPVTMSEDAAEGAGAGSSATAFAQQLAARLSRVLPRGFSASSVGAAVHLHSQDGYSATVWVNLVDDVERGSERYATAAWQVLSTAQDVVSEATGSPWPKAAGAILDLALPFTRVEERTLHLGFGDESAPAIRLAPMTLASPPSAERQRGDPPR